MSTSIPPVPTTPVTDAAAAFAALSCPTSLLRHSYRTYLFGRMLVAGDLDEDAAFVASMIHDIGLTDDHLGSTSFELVGADVAARFLERHGWEADRIRLVEQAIIRHTDLAPHDVPELRVVQAGAALDVAGIPSEVVGGETVGQILAAYPRGRMTSELRAMYLDECERQPDGAFARLEATVTLSEVMLRNPLDGAAGAAA